MSLNFLEFLSKYENEDVSGVKEIIEGKKAKIDSIVKEAFAGDYVSKDEAILRVQDVFTKKAPKSVDVDFLKENVDAIVGKIESMNEGEIKIVVNNYEAGSKGGKMPLPSVSIESDDDMLEFESAAPKKRGRPSKSADAMATKVAGKVAKKNKENIEEFKKESGEDEMDEEASMFVVTAIQKGEENKSVSKPMIRSEADKFKRELEAKATGDKTYKIDPYKPTDESVDLDIEDEEEVEETMKWADFANFMVKEEGEEDDEEDLEEKKKCDVDDVDEAKFDSIGDDELDEVVDADETEEEVEESFADVDSFLNNRLESLASKDESFYDFEDESSDVEPVTQSKSSQGYQMVADTLRQNGDTIVIDRDLPTIEIILSTNEFFFEGQEAQDLLDRVPDDVSAEDYLLVKSQGW